MNHEAFWGIIRDNLFKGKLTQGVVDTVNAIVDTYLAQGQSRPEHLAYILATAYHESYHRSKNPDWNPVREGFTKSNEAAIAVVTKLFQQGRISHNYALPYTSGNSYYGRGFVQITFGENYRKMGKRLGIDLLDDPDLALERDIAAKLLVVGMLEGLYTGRKLSDYDVVGTFDAFGARRIINGQDKAGLIHGHWEKFLFAIRASIND